MSRDMRVVVVCILAALAAITAVAVFAAIQDAAGSSFHGHSSAWKFGFDTGNDSITDCLNLSSNYVVSGIIGMDERDDFISGCRASEFDA